MTARDAGWPTLHRVGAGAPVLLVHGSAADHSTWSMQLARGLGVGLEAVAYDRRALPLVSARIETHAADAASIIDGLGGTAWVVGSSFGAVVALELARAWPAKVRGVMLCEPPLPVGAQVAAMPIFLARFDAIAREQGGAAAAAFFLDTVLGAAGAARMPARFRERCLAMSDAIRADCEALAHYHLDAAALRDVQQPVVLVGAERSAPYFRAILDWLGAALPHARRVTLSAVGHMLHAEAPRAFAAALQALASEGAGDARDGTAADRRD